MNKLKEIFQAWVIAENPTPEQKLLAEERMNTCDVCPHKKHLPVVDTYVCNMCGCPLQKKVFSPAGRQACPNNRWKR
jgi:rubredoxin